ncbi:metallophosphoesterase family protein [Deinococcus pimensis]|uniref:metallophosphoesterase family protein n=1 Tax=Deinococcus pimensis TaxID=309888 RepID=UPI000487A09F|nr:metallophosphoesterase [Deinococcus pimensis]
MLARLLLPLALALAAPSPAPFATPAEGFRMVLLSDFNGPYGATTYPAPLARVMGRVVNEWRPDLLVSAGDVVAGQKLSLTDAARRAMWAAFDRDVAAPLRNAGIPAAFAVGNHDGSSARRPDGSFTFRADRDALAAYWAARPPTLDLVERSRFPFEYTFVFRGVFFVILDASSNRVDRAWLERQLSSPEARGAAMRIVVGHLPLYGVSTERDNAGDTLLGAEDLRALMERYGVLAYVSGHHAAYYPGRRGKLNVLATGGVGGRDYVGTRGTARSTVTVADVDTRAGVVRLRTFDAATGAEVDVNTLPSRLNGVNGSVERVPELR